MPPTPPPITNMPIHKLTVTHLQLVGAALQLDERLAEVTPCAGPAVQHTTKGRQQWRRRAEQGAGRD